MTDDNRKPEDDTNAEIYDFPSAVPHTGPEASPEPGPTATPNPTITPETYHEDQDDSPIDVEPTDRRPSWIPWLFGAVALIVIAYLILR